MPTATPTVSMATPTSTTSMLYTNMYQPKVPENEVNTGLNNQPRHNYYHNTMMGGAHHDYSQVWVWSVVMAIISLGSSNGTVISW